MEMKAINLLTHWGSKMKTRIIMLSILSVLLSGCRVHEYCEYKRVDLKLFGGNLGVYVRSKQMDYQDGKKKRARHGFPYDLVIGFSAPESDGPNYERWKMLILKNITVIGVETGKKLSFKGGEEEFARIGYSAFWFPITEGMGVTYEPFDVEADIKIINADGTEESEHIKVRLEKDYRKKRQSDTWDFLESV